MARHPPASRDSSEGPQGLGHRPEVRTADRSRGSPVDEEVPAAAVNDTGNRRATPEGLRRAVSVDLPAGSKEKDCRLVLLKDSVREHLPWGIRPIR